MGVLKAVLILSCRDVRVLKNFESGKIGVYNFLKVKGLQSYPPKIVDN